MFMYSKKVMEHFMSPRNVGEIKNSILPLYKISDSIIMLFILGSRLVVGHAALDRRAEVRIPPPQP